MVTVVSWAQSFLRLSMNARTTRSSRQAVAVVVVPNNSVKKESDSEGQKERKQKDRAKNTVRLRHFGGRSGMRRRRGSSPIISRNHIQLADLFLISRWK